MIRFLDLNYHFFNTNNVSEILKRYNANFGYLFYLPKEINVNCIIQTQINEVKDIENVNFILHKGKDLYKIQVPFRLHNKVRKVNPDYVLIHGMRYGIYAYFIKKIFKTNVTLIVQVHGFAPVPSGLKRYLYKYIDKYIDGYFFTGIESASSWVDKNIFSKKKVFEIMEGSTNFLFDTSKDKFAHSYLWVGRLDQNKDPLTIINAFEIFLDSQPLAKLTMIYHENSLINEVNDKLKTSKKLNGAISLVGKVSLNEIEKYYHQHKFFILGSHYEGSGYSLLEAMACSCVPIVTKIPPYQYMTNDGECALLFSPGSKDELLYQLKESIKINYELMQEKVMTQFKKKLSHQAIANDVINTFEELSGSKKKDFK